MSINSTIDKAKSPIRGADVLARAMSNAKVDTVFSLSGNQIMPLYDAFLDVDIRVIHTRHEGAAVFMAEAYAQVNNTLGVALVTAAPGFGNALGALYSVRMSESAVVLMSGDSPVSQDGMGAFQEFPQQQAIAPFVKHSERVTHSDEFADAFYRAADIALSGRPGPTHLSLPFDVLNAVSTKVDGRVDAVQVLHPQHQLPDQQDVDQAIARVHQARCPLVLTGPQLSPTRTEFLLDKLSNTLNAPVICMESPRGLNDPALGGLSHLLADVDLVVYLGKSPDFMVGFAKALSSQTCVVIDDDSTVIDQATRIHGASNTVVVSASPLAFAQHCVHDAWARSSNATSQSAWRATVANALSTRVLSHTSVGIAPHRVAATINDWLSQQPDPILIIDGGEFGQWAQAYASSQKRITNGPSGAIGGSIPYAIATKVAFPKATVIALLGDGTCGFHLSEFETAAREGIAFIAVVGNDARWNAEHLIQVRDFGVDRAFACELHADAAYDQVAQALGGYGVSLTNIDELTAALNDARDADRPACINVRIQGVGAPVINAEDLTVKT